MRQPPAKKLIRGPLYVARVHRSELPDGSEEISLTVGRDDTVFSVQEGDEFITFVTPNPIFKDEK